MCVRVYKYMWIYIKKYVSMYVRVRVFSLERKNRPDGCAVGTVLSSGPRLDLTL
jgi:hypothetical protein